MHPAVRKTVDAARLSMALLAAPLTLVAQGASRASTEITVGPNVQVSAARPRDTHDEVLIAADPADPSHLLACSMLLPAAGVYELKEVVAYASFNGGRSWSQVLADQPDDYDRYGRFDPSCAYGPQGTAYVALLPLRVYRSADAGRTWRRVAIPAPLPQDREYVVADNTGGGYEGHVYVYAQMPGRLLDGKQTPMAITLWRSVDGGETFGNPIQSLTGQPNGETAFHPGSSVVLSDGTWAAVFNQVLLRKRNDGLLGSRRGPPSEVNGQIKVITSTDGGATLGEAITVSEAYTDWRGDNTFPMLAADPGSPAFKDRMYVAWVDGRFHGSDLAQLADGRVGGRDQVLLSYSDDHGKSWSTPRLVSDDVRYRDTGDLERGAGLVAVAVNSEGVVGVVWQDRRSNTTDEVGYDIRFAASLDGGDTFTSSVKVSEKPRIVGEGERWIAQVSATEATGLDVYRKEWDTGGHTMGLAADANGAFHPLWVDNRTGTHQVWTAAVRVRGKVARFGTPDLSMLHDLGTRVSLEATATSFDRASRRLEITVRLRNESGDTVSGPLKVRALTILSEASSSGTASVVGADNHIEGPGAVWDFTESLAGASLAPDGVSSSRELVFQLPALRETGPGREFRFGRPWPGGLLHLETQVLGVGCP